MEHITEKFKSTSTYIIASQNKDWDSTITNITTQLSHQFQAFQMNIHNIKLKTNTNYIFKQGQMGLHDN